MKKCSVFLVFRGARSSCLFLWEFNDFKNSFIRSYLGSALWVQASIVLINYFWIGDPGRFCSQMWSRLTYWEFTDCAVWFPDISGLWFELGPVNTLLRSNHIQKMWGETHSVMGNSWLSSNEKMLNDISQRTNLSLTVTSHYICFRDLLLNNNKLKVPNLSSISPWL